MPSKIFLKLLLTLLVTMTMVVLVMLLIVNWSFREGFETYIQDDERRQVDRIAEILQQQYQQADNWHFLRGNFQHWSQILEEAGEPLPSLPPGPRPDEAPPGPGDERWTPGLRPDMELSGGAGSPSWQPPPPPGPFPAHMLPLGLRLTVLDAERNRVTGPPIESERGHWIELRQSGKGIGWIRWQPASLGTDRLAQRFVDQQRHNYYLLAVFVLLLATMVATWWGCYFLRPIHQVARGAAQLTKGKLDTRVEVTTRDELGELAANFNQLAATLKQNEFLRRQWIADISHELRTPIAVLGGEIEALMDGIRQPTPDRIASLHAEVDSLGRLVEDLYQLSQSDLGVMEIKPAQVGMRGLLETLKCSFEPRMRAQGLQFRLALPEDQALTLTGDARRLRQLFSNLLENSLRYTDAGGQVLIHVAAGEDAIEIQVRDSAPGVPDGSLSRLFDRLYRVDTSRSRASGGSGLGLSICAAIVAAHDGEIQAGHATEGGLRIRIWLPRNGVTTSEQKEAN